MKRSFVAIVGVVVSLALVAGTAWAEARITVTREESKPKNVEVKVGEEVRWINASGGNAHVWFGGQDAMKFYLGKEGKVKFDKPGTYDYTVHITGTKAHEHTGTVVVK